MGINTLLAHVTKTSAQAQKVTVFIATSQMAKQYVPGDAGKTANVNKDRYVLARTFA
jgi:hypothetical protein